jgi:hypothetical protein
METSNTEGIDNTSGVRIAHGAGPWLVLLEEIVVTAPRLSETLQTTRRSQERAIGRITALRGRLNLRHGAMEPRSRARGARHEF